MKKRINVRQTCIPQAGVGIEAMPDADFGDAFSCPVDPNVRLSPDDVALGLLMSRPWWFRALLRIRGILVKPFGLRGENTKLADGDSESAGEPPAVPVNFPNRVVKAPAGDGCIGVIEDANSPNREVKDPSGTGCKGAIRDAYAPDNRYPVGSKMAFFKVEQRTPTDLLLANEDKHLKALLWITVNNREVQVITLVKFNNRFGRVYMFCIGPFHKLIVACLLRSSLTTLIEGKVPNPTSALGSD